MPINFLPRLFSRPVTTTVGMLVVFLIVRKVDMPTLCQVGWKFRDIRGWARRNLCGTVEDTPEIESSLNDASSTTSNEGIATPSASNPEPVGDLQTQSDASEHSSGCSQCTERGPQPAHDDNAQEEQESFDMDAHLRDVFRENGATPYMIERFMQDSNAAQDDGANGEAVRQNFDNDAGAHEKYAKDQATVDDCPDGTKTETREERQSSPAAVRRSRSGTRCRAANRKDRPSVKLRLTAHISLRKIVKK